ncbi:hypothetical protein [uncultured Gimesia sp.]|uniref:hypothetical protein n=1 Tax=uncultured Gimesia sp. TaxID=1678688 RepID=UPI0026337401|nr:hypothetical protein [uncultured Gimesia sp.]
MNSKNKAVYGAYICVLIRFEGNLEQLGTKLSEALQLSPFYFKPDQDPPHIQVGYAESLGWELFLEVDTENSPFNYRFSMETQICYSELDEGKMHDLSPWFARFLKIITNIEVVPGPWRLNEDEI